MMKTYQVEESWTILYKLSFHFTVDFCPIKIFKDGDILMLLSNKYLFYYSNKKRTVQQIDMFKDASKMYTFAMIFTPSLLSLKSFGFETVHDTSMDNREGRDENDTSNDKLEVKGGSGDQPGMTNEPANEEEQKSVHPNVVPRRSRPQRKRKC